LSDDVLDETMNRRTWPAHGEFDLHRFARTLMDRGWTGLVSVEVLSEELRRLDVETFTRLAYSTAVPYWVPDH
jgi:sugar phosphate isomerase/epimerase